MNEGHFFATSMVHNSPELQAEVNTPALGTASHDIPLLALQWNPTTNRISFQQKSFNLTKEALTKRKVLRMASQLFDPLGLVLPTTVLDRLFIAEL